MGFFSRKRKIETPDAADPLEKAARAWFRAAELGTTTVLNEMVKKGFDVNYEDSDGCTAFNHAVARRDVAMAHWLCEQHDADVNAGKKPALNNWAEHSADGGEYSWWIINRTVHMDLLSFLHKSGYDFNAQDQDGNTFLHILLENERFRVLSELPLFCIENVEMQTRNKKGESVLDVAAGVKYENYSSLANKTGTKDTPNPKKNDKAWIKTGESEIARVQDKRAIGYRVTEIFNFASGTYTAITTNMDTNADSQSTLLIRDMVGNQSVIDAQNALREQGGVLPDPAPVKMKTLMKPGGAES
ncbi:MAG: ankyrin repeat domain-containing protein [Alphaproteobacteria bacterium]|nr:ankyrin repeat domain-containing protein [Alphaproteobacteria bacterium]